jgi:glycosyltransferase involved in cell wall biosynthesis
LAGRILVVSDYYYPDDISTGYFLTGIAEGLAREVPLRVLCGRPVDPATAAAAPARETREGVSIRRLAALGRKDGGLLSRAARNLSFGAAVFVACLGALGRGERALVVTNPPLLPFWVALACRLRGAGCLLLIHDIYPEVLVAAGLAAPDSWSVRLLGWMNRRLYAAAERIVVLGRDAARLVAEGGGAAERILVIPNWADLGTVRPAPRADNPLLRGHGLLDKFVVQFSGNMGRTHDLESVVACAESLSADADIHFLLSGWGSKRSWLEEAIREKRLANVSLLDRQPREALSDLLNAADLLLIAFVPGMAGVSVPGRLYNMMAAGKPILAAAETGSELALVIAEEDIGWTVPPAAPAALAAAILAAKADPDGLARRGADARRAAEAKYGQQSVVDAFVRLLRGLPDGPS